MRLNPLKLMAAIVFAVIAVSCSACPDYTTIVPEDRDAIDYIVLQINVFFKRKPEEGDMRVRRAGGRGATARDYEGRMGLEVTIS